MGFAKLVYIPFWYKKILQYNLNISKTINIIGSISYIFMILLNKNYDFPLYFGG